MRRCLYPTVLVTLGLLGTVLAGVQVSLAEAREQQTTVAPCTRASRGVTLFEKSSCAGRFSNLQGDVNNLGRLRVGNDAASSLALRGDFAVTLYRHAGFRGEATTFVASDTNFGNDAIGHDRASSVRIRRGGCDGSPGVYLYSDSGFEGRCSRFTRSVRSLRPEYVLNDKASSIRIIGDYAVTVYQHADFSGRRSTKSVDDRTFGDDEIDHDEASSIRIREGNTLCTSGTTGVFLYRETGFKGRCSRFTDDEPDLSLAYVGEDLASSVRVSPGYTAEVFANRRLRGDRTTFSGADPNFGNDEIRHDRASSIRVTGPSPEEASIWRLQLRITTGDIGDAGTGDDVQVSLNAGNFTWLNYGVIEDYDGTGTRFAASDDDDFERAETFTYDLLTDGVQNFEDIDWLTLSKGGSDGWCVGRVELLVNNVAQPVADRRFSPCHWLDNEDGHRRSRAIRFDSLRGGALWRAFQQPSEISRALISRPELVSRIHGIVGHAIHGTGGYWGKLQGSASVEIARVDDSTVHVDLDLSADVPLLDPEIDVDFDIELSCAVQGGTGVVTLKVAQMKVVADLDNIEEIFLFFIEDNIEQAITSRLPELSRQIPTGSAQCPSITVLQDGGLLFGPPA
jgi:hypothetical protein